MSCAAALPDAQGAGSDGESTRLVYSLRRPGDDGAHRLGVGSVVVHDGLLYTGGKDGAVRVWDLGALDGAHGPGAAPALPSPPLVRCLRGPAHWVTGLAAAPELGVLAGVSADCGLYLWRLGRPRHQGTVAGGATPATAPLFGHDDSIKGVCFARSERAFFTGGLDCRLVRWDAATLRPVAYAAAATAGAPYVVKSHFV